MAGFHPRAAAFTHRRQQAGQLAEGDVPIPLTPILSCGFTESPISGTTLVVRPYSSWSTKQSVLRDDDTGSATRHRGAMSALVLAVLLSLVSAVAYAAAAIVQERVAASGPSSAYAPVRRPAWW